MSFVSRYCRVKEGYEKRFYSISPETETVIGGELKKFYPDNDPEIETPTQGIFAPSFSQLNEKTPLVDLTPILGSPDTVPKHVKLVAKMEYLNPAMSVKDRAPSQIISNAVEDGLVDRKGKILCYFNSEYDDSPISVAMACAMLGLKSVTIVSEKDVENPKVRTVQSFGSSLYVARNGEACDELAKKLILGNPEEYFLVDTDSEEAESIHYNSIAPEIWRQTGGMVTHFVASKSASFFGVEKYLSEATEGKVESILATREEKPSSDRDSTDKVIVSESETLFMCHQLARSQGLCLGPGSGLNVSAAVRVAKRIIDKENSNDGSTARQPLVICTILPDSGLQYLDTIYNAQWLERNHSIRVGEIPPLNRSRASDSTSTFKNLFAFAMEDIIGETPLCNLSHLVKNVHGHNVKLFAKVEFFNPGYSIKDRIVRNIFEEAEADGRLRPGMTVVAASSGNTGAATAMMCAVRGYNCIITTSPKCSQEKMDAIRAYGAKLLVSPPGAKEGDASHYMNMARNLAKENPDWFDVDQYYNPSNPKAHSLTLGPEIWDQTLGKVTHFIAAGSTGGTVSGTSLYLKSKSPEVKAVLADPVGSIFTEYFHKGSFTKPGKFLVEGVGKGSIPGTMDMDIIDAVLPVSDADAFDRCSQLACNEGILAGGSGGLNVHAAVKLGETLDEDAIIVTVLPDSGMKYQSKVYNPKWLKENGVMKH